MKVREMNSNELINFIYNDFMGNKSDIDDVDFGHGGKSIPYVGWYWRNADFANDNVSIGDCGEFIGVMQSNKWGHPERDLSPFEVAELLDLIDEAMEYSYDKDILYGKLEKVWDWFQELEIK
jgi:hypothetical protein